VVIFPNVPARFHSDFSISESVARLSAAIQSPFSSLTFARTVGRVNAAKVTLWRVQPTFRNSFKPVFVGRFRDDAGGVVLEGRFTLFASSKAFMTIWLGAALLITAYSVFLSGVVAIVNRDWRAFAFVPIGFAFFGVGVAFVRLCWGLSRSDVDVLSHRIRSALSSVNSAAT